MQSFDKLKKSNPPLTKGVRGLLIHDLALFPQSLLFSLPEASRLFFKGKIEFCSFKFPLLTECATAPSVGVIQNLE
jgi:hypothetical protein